MQCPSCSTENREDAKFCVKCGRGLVLACPACGNPHGAADLFCAECGRVWLPDDRERWRALRIDEPHGDPEVGFWCCERANGTSVAAS